MICELSHSGITTDYFFKSCKIFFYYHSASFSFLFFPFVISYYLVYKMKLHKDIFIIKSLFCFLLIYIKRLSNLTFCYFFSPYFYRHDIAELLLKVALNTVTITIFYFFLNIKRRSLSYYYCIEKHYNCLINVQ
jgi:hypothetical protein